MTILEFVASTLRNQWIVEEDNLEVYVRRSKRLYKGQFINCLDISTVSAKRQGQGQFTRFISKLEGNYNLYIENVQTKRFQEFFEKRNYELYFDDGMSKTYILPSKDMKHGH